MSTVPGGHVPLAEQCGAKRRCALLGGPVFVCCQRAAHSGRCAAHLGAGMEMTWPGGSTTPLEDWMASRDRGG